MPGTESARDAYDRYAAVYDECNAQNDYEMWLGKVLLPELEKHGLRKGWALDVGCGTGKAFAPLLSRGWHLVGCDVSSAMLAEARQKFGPSISLVNADARELSLIHPSEEEEFQLILLLNDVLNYMTEDGDLRKVFAGVKQNLNRQSGLAVFDINTISLYRSAFTSGVSAEMSARGLEWRGLTDNAGPGVVYEAQLSGPGVKPHVHRQRHWTIEQVRQSLEAAHLSCLAVLGQREQKDQILLSEFPDENRDYKLIFIVGHTWSRSCDPVAALAPPRYTKHGQSQDEDRPLRPV